MVCIDCLGPEASLTLREQVPWKAGSMAREAVGKELGTGLVHDGLQRLYILGEFSYTPSSPSPLWSHPWPPVYIWLGPQSTIFIS